MQRLSAAIALLLMVAMMASCASTPSAMGPSMRSSGGIEAWPLSPRDLAAPLALQQQLVIERGVQAQTFEALLEADGEGLQLAVQAMGQTAMSLHWDGNALDEQRADWLPPQVDGARVLQDLQFALWPIGALQRAAPIGWRVVEEGGDRRVFDGEGLVVRIHGNEANSFTLERPRDGYRLRVISVELGGVEP